MRASQHNAAAAGGIAGHADAERRLDNAFELQRTIFFLPLAGKHAGCFLIRPDKRIAHARPHLGAFHQDEIPRLHEADRRRVMGGG